MQEWNPPVEVSQTIPKQEGEGRLAQAPCSGCNCAARIRKEHPDMQPSGGYDEIDELLGLLRVARMNRDMAEAEVLRLRKEMLALTREAYTLPPSIHACQNCGRPGASMHYPGGYLCPDGCKEVLPGVSPNAAGEPQPTCDSRKP